MGDHGKILMEFQPIDHSQKKGVIIGKYIKTGHSFVKYSITLTPKVSRGTK
jgi:hypothetical protein